MNCRRDYGGDAARRPASWRDRLRPSPREGTCASTCRGSRCVRLAGHAGQHATRDAVLLWHEGESDQARQLVACLLTDLRQAPSVERQRLATILAIAEAQPELLHSMADAARAAVAGGR